jgi:putative hydrolase of HD superfamily
VKNAAEYNYDQYNAVDGTLTASCDKLCAYIEASMALEYGIKSDTLMQSKQSLYDKYAVVNKNNLNFKQLFDYFK